MRITILFLLSLVRMSGEYIFYYHIIFNLIRSSTDINYENIHIFKKKEKRKTTTTKKKDTYFYLIAKF